MTPPQPLHTHECRWFFDGPPPEDLVGWFRTVAPWEQAPDVAPPEWPTRWREDRYLVLAPRDDMGVKSRREPGADGAADLLVEFKGRTAEPGPVELARGVVGVVDRWMKWSYGAEAVPPSLVELFHGPAVRTVRKKRLLRVVRFPSGGAPVEVRPAATPPPRAVGVELTHVELPGGEAWTVGLEAAPVDAATAADFRTVARPLLERWPSAPRPTPDRSMSYPAWLLTREAPGAD